MQAYLFGGVRPSRAPFGVEHLLEFFVRSFATKKAEEVVREGMESHAVAEEVHRAYEQLKLASRGRLVCFGNRLLLILTKAVRRAHGGGCPGWRRHGLAVVHSLGEDEVGEARV